MGLQCRYGPLRYDMVAGRCGCSVDRLLRVSPLVGCSDMIWNSGAGLIAVNDDRLVRLGRARAT